MTTTVGPPQCAGCDKVLGEEFCLPEPDRLPCPYCGSMGRRYVLEVGITNQILPSLNAEGRRAGMSRGKGWFKRIRLALVAQGSRGGAIAQHERIIDRDNHRYTETVMIRDTGEIVHHCDEPLSKHRGHGSDKPVPSSSDCD
jgi:hypothetical protein